MIKIPAKFKHKKVSKGRLKTSVARTNNKIVFGDYAIKSLDYKRLTFKELQSAEKILRKKLGKIGKIWARVNPNIPVTKKAAETRMGKGKGSVEFWITRVVPGTVIFEVGGIKEDIANSALQKCNDKLSIDCMFVRSNDEVI